MIVFIARMAEPEGRLIAEAPAFKMVESTTSVWLPPIRLTVLVTKRPPSVRNVPSASLLLSSEL